MFLSVSSVVAQRATISVDPLRLAIASPNVTAEVVVSRHVTLGVDVTLDPFEGGYGGLSTKLVSVSPELRYYFKRPCYSHFVGANIIRSVYDVRYRDRVCDGSMLGAGVIYGYSLYLWDRWSLTPSIGLGVAYQKSNLVDGGTNQNIESGFKPSITKFGMALTYIID